MRNAASFLLMVFAQVMCAQELPSVKDKAKGYVNTLAGPAMYGRGYVKGGDSLAAEWMAQQFGRIGLEPLNKQRFEPFSFPVNTFPDSVRVVGVAGKKRPAAVEGCGPALLRWERRLREGDVSAGAKARCGVALRVVCGAR